MIEFVEIRLSIAENASHVRANKQERKMFWGQIQVHRRNRNDNTLKKYVTCSVFAFIGKPK